MSKILFANQIRIQNKYLSNVTRRNFLSSCSACAACMAIAPMSFGSTSCSTGNNGKKMRIRILYSLHEPVQNRPDWPNIGFDFNPVMEQINAALSKKFSNFEFIPTLSKGPDEAEKITQMDAKESIDGYIVYQMNCWNKVVQTIANTGKPVLYADFQFGGSGGFLVYSATFLRTSTPNVRFVASSNIEDRLLNAYKRIRSNSRNGLAVVAVERDACGGCYNKIPPQRQLDIRLNKKIIVCEHCGRVLVDGMLIPDSGLEDVKK